MAACGLSPSRAAALARLVRTLDPESLRAHGTAAVASRLGRERGLGPWSAGVAAIWGLGRLDLGLVGDLGLIRLASRLHGRPATAEDTAAVLASFGAWAGLASLHLLAHPWAAAPAPPSAMKARCAPSVAGSRAIWNGARSRVGLAGHLLGRERPEEEHRALPRRGEPVRE